MQSAVTTLCLSHTCRNEDSGLVLSGVDKGRKVERAALFRIVWWQFRTAGWSIFTLPFSIRLSYIDRVTFKIRPPLAIYFYIHLQDQVSTVFVIATELS